MTTIYIMRHGETTWNRSLICQGRLDNPLNEVGYQQAVEKGKELKLGHFQIDYIYSSSLYRAIQTAEILSSSLNYKGEIKKMPEFVERDFGELEGKDVRLVRQVIQDHLEKNINGYESDKQVIERVKKGLFELAKKHEGKRILLVAHSHVIKCLLSYLKPDQFTLLTSLPNLNISELEVDEKEIRLIKKEYKSGV